jgi:hypothetical protein
VIAMAFLLKRKTKLKYPFSKFRVYFNAVAGSIALLISISLLLSYSDVLAIFIYLSFSFVLTLLSLRLKLYLLERMERIEEEDYPETIEPERRFLNWRLIMMVVLLVLVLVFPVISTLFVSPLWWFIGFSGFVVGMSLSEVLLFLSVTH